MPGSNFSAQKRSLRLPASSDQRRHALCRIHRIEEGLGECQRPGLNCGRLPLKLFGWTGLTSFGRRPSERQRQRGHHPKRRATHVCRREGAAARSGLLLQHVEGEM